MSLLPMVGKRLRYAGDKIMKADNNLQGWCDKLEMADLIMGAEVELTEAGGDPRKVANQL